MNCRHCHSTLTLTFVDLGSAPPSNAFLTKAQLDEPELWYPLRVMVCESCWLVQTADFTRREDLFDEDYAYFSSCSQGWLEHSRRYVEMIIARLSLDQSKHVVEVAANDGYLLRYFLAAGIPCTGIEPTASTAASARSLGIPIVQDFFGSALAGRMADDGLEADLMIANNVLAHVPDINDFVGGFARLLKAEGVATFEFPHLLRLIEETQFDTIYHEHFSYLSLLAVVRIFAANGLSLFDVEELKTHGGSLRIFAQRADSGTRAVTPAVEGMLDRERGAGLDSAGAYEGFQARAERIRQDLLAFLLEARRGGLRVAGYGAAAKGNTLLNFAGVREDLVTFVCDRAPSKQGKYLPGSRIPVLGEEAIAERRPDYVLVLPWNLSEEITEQLSYVSEWGGQFVRAVPRLRVWKPFQAAKTDQPGLVS